jgi:hypothetical protein
MTATIDSINSKILGLTDHEANDFCYRVADRAIAHYVYVHKRGKLAVLARAARGRDLPGD